MNNISAFGLLLLFIYFSMVPSYAQKKNDLEGRWDLDIEFQGKIQPSWLEIRHSGHETFIGRFVFAFGSARPISDIKIYGNRFTFQIPRQWEPDGSDMILHGQLKDKAISGTILYTDGSIIHFNGKPAAQLPHIENPQWGKTIALFNGQNVEGWYFDSDDSHWSVSNGILTNVKGGANLISKEKFTDFKIEAEFRYPKGSNSGIYLRGRYEVQIADNFGLEASDIYFGGIYGFLEPNENVARPAGEWQQYGITLIGNRVTIVANGKTIIENQTIPGITGGALDSAEGKPGPIMIQGDHGPIEFKKFELTPIN